MPRRLSLIELVVVLANLAILAALAHPALLKARSKAHRSKCAGNLQQLGMAAISYCDDKRFFPHVGRLVSVTGGWETSEPSRTVRALLWYGYLDSVEGWVCPDADDRVVGPRDLIPGRRWFWSSWRADGAVTGGPGAAGGDPRRSPFVDGLPDHSLDGTDELSYGWTRKGLNGGVRSVQLLSVDRGVRVPFSRLSARRNGEVGNHTAGWNLLQADGSTLWLALGNEAGRDLLARTDRPDGGFLAMQDPRHVAW